MSGIFTGIIPIFLIAFLGFFLKRMRVFKIEHGDLFLKLVFYISLPALILISYNSILLKTSLIILPLASAFIILFIYLISRLLSGVLHLDRPSLGVFYTGTLILNIGFVLPFVITSYGDEGLARIILMDVSNGILAFSLVYSLAVKLGPGKKSNRKTIKKLLQTPPLWAIAISIPLNLMEIRMPVLLIDFCEQLGALTIPLLLLSVGIYFNPKIIMIKPLLSIIAIRMGLGFLLAFMIVEVFSIEGLNRIIIILGGAAPVGYNTLVFSSLEDLNKEFASSVVSYSLFIGLISVPLLIYLFG